MLDFYNEKIFARLMNHGLSSENLALLRRDLLAHANGEILEIGFGTGLNLTCYPHTIRSITAIDVNSFKPISFNDWIQVRILTMSAEKMNFQTTVLIQ